MALPVDLTSVERLTSRSACSALPRPACQQHWNLRRDSKPADELSQPAQLAPLLARSTNQLTRLVLSPSKFEIRVMIKVVPTREEPEKRTFSCGKLSPVRIKDGFSRCFHFASNSFLRC